MKVNEAARSELIGLTIRIVNAKNPSLAGLTGRVVDETKNSFVIETNLQRKTVLKNQLIELEIVEKNLKVQGKDLMKRPEERIQR